MANGDLNQVMDNYYREFSSLDVESILKYFNEPALLVGPQGVIPVPDHAALASAFRPVMEGLRAKGFGRSEYEQANIKELSSSAAIVGVVAVRYKATGEEMERVGMTYVLDKRESGWKFATVVMHDAEAR